MKLIQKALASVATLLFAALLMAQSPAPNYVAIPDYTGIGAGQLFRTDINNHLSGVTPIAPQLVTIFYSQLPPESDGKLFWVRDAAPGSNPCTGGGQGALAVGMQGQWNCQSGSGFPVPAGTTPRIVGYDGSGNPESEAVTGDATFTRLGANSYGLTVTKINGTTPGNNCTNQFERSINGSGVGTCNSIATADLPTTGVSAGSYTGANITVDATGRISSAANGSTTVPTGTSPQLFGWTSGGVGESETVSGDATFSRLGANSYGITISQIGGVTPGNTCTNQFERSINGHAVGTCGSIATADLPTSGVSAGSYIQPSLTVDATGRITSIAAGASVMQHNTASPSTTAMSPGSPTTISTISVTMPSSGCPCRALVSYALFGNQNSSGSAAGADVSDGTHIIAPSQVSGNAGTALSGQEELAGTAFSPVTYSNSASKTFTLTAESTNAAVMGTTAGTLGDISTYSVDILSSN